MTFKDMSIKRKLMLITIVTSSLALLLASIGFVVYDLTAFRARMSQDLVTQAKIIGANSTAALAFRDDNAVREILSALRAKDEVEAAAIYTPDGRVFADYRRDAQGSTIPPAPETPGYRFDEHSLRVFYRIVLHDQTLGTLYIESNMDERDARLRNYTAIVGILMLGSALVALLLSSRMQRVISEPILELERTMKTVSAQKTFSLRVTKSQHDEIGVLIDGFNEMLAEIQQRDAALQGANDELRSRTLELEQEIGERLRAQEDLKTLNTTLEQRVAERSAAAEQRAEELARSKDALQKQTRILQSILDTMSDGVIVADDSGTVILSNPAAADLLHLEQSDTLTGQWTERHGFYLPDTVTPYPNDQFPLMQAIRGTAVEAAQVFVVEPIKAPGGIWLSVDAMPLTDEDGVLHNGVAILHNITAQKKAEEALLRAKDAAVAASLAKSQFLANMSHELRTPLNAIIGYSEMLEESAQEEGHEESIPDLQKIHAAGKHLQSLIDGILDLSKIEAGKMELLLETFDVSSMVHDVSNTVQSLVEKNGNTLQIRCSGELGYMRADPLRIRQVLFNLLSNAGKFTSNGTVSLDVLRIRDNGRDWIHFQIADTGIGMTEEQSARLFQDFAQVDASTTRKYGGTGLGLAISRRFSEMMGGDLAVASTPGVGSVFTFRVPARIEAIARDSSRGAGRAPAVATPIDEQNNRVLVIDDDPDVRDLMARVLSKEGFEVVLAADGDEGLALAKQLRPAAITLDVIMPGVSGWSVLTALKADPEVSDIPVIMVTMTDDRRMGYALGACDYLTKPVDPARLAGVLRRHTTHTDGALVLVVDDDPAARQMMGRMLTKDGWSVSEAENGRVALDRLRGQHPSVIVLDLIMPEVDGFDFLEILRKTPAWRAIPVVVVTAKDLSEEESRWLNGSVSKVLSKAASRCEELLPVIREQLRAQLRLSTPTR
jgi:signal transduction histidine kinase/DNA-binding response OmpR family regulator/methyl-accepting chemotaxis protein